MEVCNLQSDGQAKASDTGDFKVDHPTTDRQVIGGVALGVVYEVERYLVFYILWESSCG